MIQRVRRVLLRANRCNTSRSHDQFGFRHEGVVLAGVGFWGGNGDAGVCGWVLGGCTIGREVGGADGVKEYGVGVVQGPGEGGAGC